MYAEEQTYLYIRRNYRHFHCVDVLKILPYLPCLTANDQDRLRATYTRIGNQDTLWDLFNSLQWRKNWVVCLIEALRACAHSDLAKEVTRVYESNLAKDPKRPRASLEPAEVSRPAEVPGPAEVPCVPYNGYREDESSYPTPVQATRPPESLGEKSEQAPQTPSFGAVPRKPHGPPDPSSDVVALSPSTSGRHQEQDSELGNTHLAGVVSSPTTPRGPVSPSVSFQPLARSTPRASSLPGPPVSAPPSGTSSSSIPPGLASPRGAGDQGEVPTCDTTSKLPTMPVKTVPSKVPASSASAHPVPSKLPTSVKPAGTMPPNVPPSKLPITTACAGTVPPKVSTGLGSEHRTPTGPGPNKVPTKAVPRNRPEKTTEALAPAGPRGHAPWSDNRTEDLATVSELSKPGVLLSRVDSQPFSISSEDLAISHSDSLQGGPVQVPEENECVCRSVTSFEIHTAEDPSADLLDGNPRSPVPLEPPVQEVLETEVQYNRLSFWKLGFTVATAGVLLAALLLLYLRRLPQ
ncbi:PREDICTED: mitochondrial antiviral-signaling protein-like [Elephantulus edwardii]|uniref:mitochondrial antiviral-signaling protein-like n=1 Tax=Elephantulus edwardii TaxID=28737 RepID=UPI0003F07300|nr:PREDICTED: mitochondrial antiviral-signaling protein-like [Elephantulus edwardii]